MAMTKQKYKNDCIIFSTLNDLVPQEHLVRKLDNCMDFTFIEELVKDLYSDFGRPSIPPVVLFKLIFINVYNQRDWLLCYELQIFIILSVSFA